jgi:hypothetical protein
MDLTRFREFSPDVYRHYPLDEWSSSLRSVCGNFQPKPCDGVRRVTGRVHPSTAGGTEFVQVANNLAIIQRDLNDIRRVRWINPERTWSRGVPQLQKSRPSNRAASARPLM